MNEDHNQGFIALWRSLLGWEWYMDINTCRLFVHLLLTVQYAERRTRGRVIRRGQRLCSVQILASETGLSVQQVRTALEHLKSTGDVTSSASPQGTVITVKNYGKYQIPTNTSTSGQQTDNKRPNKPHLIKKIIYPLYPPQGMCLRYIRLGMSPSWQR